MNHEIPKLKKVFALIPESLFEEMQKRGLFYSGFDTWAAQAFSEKLEKEGAIGYEQRRRKSL
jgi:hypothetical protein